MYDLAVRGGTLVGPMTSERGDVAVRGERIAAVGSGSLDEEAAVTIDATGCLVIRGGVDPHCHCNMGFGEVVAEPQQYLPSGPFGGDTTIIDFVLQEPPTSLHDAVDAKKTEAAGQMAVDYELGAVPSAQALAGGHGTSSTTRSDLRQCTGLGTRRVSPARCASRSNTRDAMLT